MGADPDIPLTVFEEGGYRPLRKAGAITGLVLVMEEEPRRGVEEIETAVDAACPELSFFINQQTADQVAAQAARLLVGMAIADMGVLYGVEKKEAVVLCAEPEIPLSVLPDGGDDV